MSDKHIGIKAQADGCPFNSKLQVSAVYPAVQEVVDWMTLGVHLKLELPKLKRIEQSYSEPKRRLQEMLGIWLETFPEASWNDLVKALQSMGQNVLAQSIEEEYMNANIEEKCPYKRPRIDEKVEPMTAGEGTNKQSTTDVQEKAVEVNYQSIMERFMKLVLYILKSLEALNLDIKDVCLAVSNFPYSSKHSNLLLFDKQREEIRNATSLRDLFNILSHYKYWDWKNYELLSAIVSIFGTKNEQTRVRDYEKELQAFYVNLKLSNLVETIPQGKDKPIEKPDFVRLTAKLEKGIPWADYTMQCVEEFWQSFVDEYLFKKYTLFFHDAKPGCACLTFLVPEAISPHIIAESQSKAEFFITHNVVRLTIRDKCVYDRESEQTGNSKEDAEMECLKGENESLKKLVQALEQTNADQQELITELRAQQRISRPVGAQSTDVNAEDEYVAYTADNRSHFSWTLNLNGFFYNHIHGHDSNVLSSSYFFAPDGKSHFQVLLCPRSFDKWDSRHCSLFLVAHGSEIQLPVKAVLQCRLPGLQGEGDVEQHFQFSQSDLLKQSEFKLSANCSVVSSIHSFLSYSFFMKHLNIIPFFQIVVNLFFE